MRIIQINKFFTPRGGADVYYLELIKLLREKGFDVIPFSMKLPLSRMSDLPGYSAHLYEYWQNFFVNFVDFSRPWRHPLRALELFWRPEAAVKMRALLKQEIKGSETQTVAHLHNIYHQISPSILPVLRQWQIPVVMSVHDLGIISSLYAENLLEKVVCQLEVNLHKNLYRNYVDVFLAPSKFVRRELIKAGFPKSKIKILPLFAPSPKQAVNYSSPRPFILYFGRLQREKGVDILLEALALTRTKPDLIICGRGSGREFLHLKNLAQKLGIQGKVLFQGFRAPKELAGFIKACLFPVFPSRVPETFGLGILESFVLGKPAIGPAWGAVPELITHKKSGLLFEPLSAKDLADKIDYLVNRPELAGELGRNAREFSQEFSSQRHIRRLLAIYSQITLPGSVTNFSAA